MGWRARRPAPPSTGGRRGGSEHSLSRLVLFFCVFSVASCARTHRRMNACYVQAACCRAHGGEGEKKNKKHTRQRMLYTKRQGTTHTRRWRSRQGSPHVLHQASCPGRSPQNLRGSRRLQTLVNRLRCDRTLSSRNLFGECAKNRQGTSAWPAAGASYQRRVFRILPLQST